MSENTSSSDRVRDEGKSENNTLEGSGIFINRNGPSSPGLKQDDNDVNNNKINNIISSSSGGSVSIDDNNGICAGELRYADLASFSRARKRAHSISDANIRETMMASIDVGEEREVFCSTINILITRFVAPTTSWRTNKRLVVREPRRLSTKKHHSCV